MTCPLCCSEFAGQAGCRHCGLVSRCALVRCPSCGYEFVERSRVVEFISRVVLRRKMGALPLSQGHPRERYLVVRIASSSPVLLGRLTGLGIFPGTEIFMTQRRPAFVIRAGETDIALDREIAEKIQVTPASPPSAGSGSAEAPYRSGGGGRS